MLEAVVSLRFIRERRIVWVPTRKGLSNAYGRHGHLLCTFTRDMTGILSSGLQYFVVSRDNTRIEVLAGESESWGVGLAVHSRRQLANRGNPTITCNEPATSIISSIHDTPIESHQTKRTTASAVRCDF
jgi:hypothetical protein